MQEMDYPLEERASMVDFIPRLNELIDYFHNKGLPIYHSMMKEYPCVEDWDKIMPEVHRYDSDVIVSKPQNDAFENPDLTKLLRDRNVCHVVVAGVVLSSCVALTAIGAVKNKFQATIASEAVSEGQGEPKNLEYSLEIGVSLKTNREILSVV